MCAQADGQRAASRSAACCPLFHEAVELIGKRWSGAILRVLLDGPKRFSELSQAVPELSDRLLMKQFHEPIPAWKMQLAEAARP